MESKKWYGLKIPKKTAKVNTKGKSVFESDDSDDNREQERFKIKKEPSSPPKEKKKRAPDSKPVEMDPNIYEYDSIYDDMKASQKQKTSHLKSKEPRYINLLLKAADKRKKESERRVERKIQAERVKEGNTFKDKEAFVTSAYRQKMIEMEEEEEHERRESVLEEMMDSTKQKDLSGFYRHFLKQTVGEEKVPEFGERDAKASSTTKTKQDHSETDKSRQRSESPVGTRTGKKHSYPDDKDAHSDIKRDTEKSHKSDSSKSENRHGSHGEHNKSGHSKDKTSHKNKSRHRSNSSSDSEGRKNKHSEEKSHKRKSDHSTYNSSKPLHDEKQKNSHSSRSQEEKMHDRDKSGHSKSTAKQTSPPGKHRNDRSPNKSKLDKAGKDYRMEARAHSKTERGSSQTNPKPTSDEKNSGGDKSSSSNKSSVSKAKNHSDDPSKKRESRSSDECPENKRRKYNDDDDDDNDDSSIASSVEDEVVPKDNQKEEDKEAPEKRKTDMITKFAKRTVGKIFDDAQARYFKRKEARVVG